MYGEGMYAASYDLIVLDCDGVLWLGDEPLEGVAGTLRTLVEAGKRLYFVTNNSQWSTADVAAKLRRLGYGEFVTEGNVWTAVSATVGYFDEKRRAAAADAPPPAAFVIGSAMLKDALAAAGVRLVRPTLTEAERLAMPDDAAGVEVDPAVRTVVVGFDRTFCYFSIAYAVRCLLENPGCELVATNRDYQFPIQGKRLPGAGALVAAVCAGAGREPDAVAAKPSPLMLNAIMAEAGVAPSRTLMVGDMWSDVAFGHRAGARAALVLSGVARAEDVLGWSAEAQPDAVLADARGLVDAALLVES